MKVSFCTERRIYMSLLRNFADSNQRLGYKLLSEDDKSVTLYKVCG